MADTAEQDADWLLLQDLNFGLDNINGLTTVQLCLVQFHPEADEAAKAKAELVYWRRCDACLVPALRTIGLTILITSL